MVQGPIPAPEGSVDADVAAFDPLGAGGLGGADLRRWRYSPRNDPWVMIEKSHRPAVAYAGLVLRSDRARTVELALGTDDGYELWLNKRRLRSSKERRRAASDTQLVSLELRGGDNVLVMRLWRYQYGPWRLIARLVDKELAYPSGVTAALPGVKIGAAQALVEFGALDIERELGAADEKIRARARLRFPAGAPLLEGASLASLLRARGAERLKKTIDTAAWRAPAPIDLFDEALSVSSLTGEETVDVSAGGQSLREALALWPEHLRSLGQARRALGEPAVERLPRLSRESLAWRVEDLAASMASGLEDKRFLDREWKLTGELIEEAREGRDPYAERRGEIQRRGYRSSVDGRLHSFDLYVPKDWAPGGKGVFGLVVSLHGYLGPTMKALLAVFGEAQPKGVDRDEWVRHPPGVEDKPYFVVAPNGMGASGYVGFGEIDVLEVLARAAEYYPIDPERIYITGASMGGTGSAAIALHYPDIFAAAAPLGGSHDAFAYSDVKHWGLRPWEVFLAEAYSNSYWAGNGAGTPMYLVHGKKDGPRFSIALADAYRLYGQEVKLEVPNLGHNVWDLTYRNGRIFDYFAEHRREDGAREVYFRSARMRYRKSDWILVDAARDYSAWTTAWGRWIGDDEVELSTDNVTALTVLVRPERAASVNVRIDGRGVGTFGFDDMRCILLPENYPRVRGEAPACGLPFHRAEDGRWYPGSPPPCKGLCKKPGLAGPLDDALFERLLFVYGTNDPGEAPLARRMVERLSPPMFATTVQWEVKADKDVTEQDLENRSLVLVGTPRGNGILRRIMETLPIRADEKGITVGDRRFEGPETAASFIYPSPLSPRNYVVVHTGVSKRALFYIDHLPRWLPDYVIYNGSNWDRKGGRFFGPRAVLTAGFFDERWRLR